MSNDKRRILFLDRDGTLIIEPEDEQIDSLEKLELVEGVIPALLRLKDAGYEFVIVSNQDGLGTPANPIENFQPPHDKMLSIFASQGIRFAAEHFDPHFEIVDHILRELSLRRHHEVLMRDRVVKPALLQIARYDRGPGAPADPHQLAGIQPKPPSGVSGLVGVASITLTDQHGTDLRLEELLLARCDFFRKPRCVGA